MASFEVPSFVTRLTRFYKQFITYEHFNRCQEFNSTYESLLLYFKSEVQYIWRYTRVYSAILLLSLVLGGLCKSGDCQSRLDICVTVVFWVVTSC